MHIVDTGVPCTVVAAAASQLPGLPDNLWALPCPAATAQLRNSHTGAARAPSDVWLLAVSGQLLGSRLYVMRGRKLLADVTHLSNCDAKSKSLAWESPSPRHVLQVTKTHVTVIDTWRLIVRLVATCVLEVFPKQDTPYAWSRSRKGAHRSPLAHKPPPAPDGAGGSGLVATSTIAESPTVAKDAKGKRVVTG